MEHQTYHLAANPALYEPQRSNNFEFVVTGLTNLIRAGSNPGDNTNVIQDGQEVLRLSVNNVNIPNVEQGVIEVKRGNTVTKFAGSLSFSEGSFDIVDYIGADSQSIVLAWQRLSGDVVTGNVGLASEYKKNGTLIEYTPDYKKIVRYWDIEGAWIRSTDGTGKFDHENNDKKTITVTVVFDRAIPHLPDGE